VLFWRYIYQAHSNEGRYRTQPVTRATGNV
jgi:hypothetical protein